MQYPVTIPDWLSAEVKQVGMPKTDLRSWIVYLGCAWPQPKAINAEIVNLSVGHRRLLNLAAGNRGFLYSNGSMTPLVA